MIDFGGSFSDKGVLPGLGVILIDFMNVVQSSKKCECNSNK